MHAVRMDKEKSYPFVKLVPTMQHTYIFGFEYLMAYFTGICTQGLWKQMDPDNKSLNSFLLHHLSIWPSNTLPLFPIIAKQTDGVTYFLIVFPREILGKNINILKEKYTFKILVFTEKEVLHIVNRFPGKILQVSP